MNFQQVERRFAQLKRQFEARQISEEKFKEEVERLQAKDDLGRVWTIGAQSGKWYYYDGHRWVQARPPRTVRRVSSRSAQDTIPAPGRAARRPDADREDRTIPAWAWFGLAGVVAALVLVITVILALRLIRGQPGGTTAGDFTPQPLIIPTATPASLPPSSPVPTAPALASINMKQYGNIMLGISLEYPEGWQKKEELLQIVFAPDERGLDADNIGGPFFMIETPVGEETDSPEQILARKLATLPEHGAADISTVPFTGEAWAAKKVSFDAPSLGRPVTAYVAAANRAGGAYVITCLAPSEDWERYWSVFGAMVGSFEFTTTIAEGTPLLPTPRPTDTPIVIVVTPTPLPVSPTTETPAETAIPPTPTPKGREIAGRIIYPAHQAQGQIFEIWLADLASGEQSMLVSNASQPAFSKDGGRFLYRSWVPQQRGVAIYDFASGPRLLTPFLEDGVSDWLPGEESIVFVSRREGDRASRIYNMELKDGSDAIRTGLTGDFVTVMPSGRLVYKGCVGGECGLYIANVDGSKVERLTDGGSDFSISVSPEGGRIAIMSYDRDKNWEVYVMDTAGAGLQNITNNPANDGIPTWSPDGKSIAFASDRDGTWAVWAVNPDGSDPQKLFNMKGPPEGQVGHDLPGSSAPLYLGWAEERMSWRP